MPSFLAAMGFTKDLKQHDSQLEAPILSALNFGCLSGFIDAQGRLLVADERGNATWKPLLFSLHAAGIKADECFFTNAWPFLHEGESNLGPIGDWLEDEELMTACVGFFEYTFKIMRPRLIIGLGIGPAALLSRGRRALFHGVNMLFRVWMICLWQQFIY